MYKKYVYRDGKRFGPYYCESYRDKHGKVKTRFVGTENPNKKSIILIIILSIFLVSLLLFFVYIQNQVEISNGFKKIISGFIVSKSEEAQTSQQSAEDTAAESSVESSLSEETPAETIIEQPEEIPAETPVEETPIIDEPLIVIPETNQTTPPEEIEEINQAEEQIPEENITIEFPTETPIVTNETNFTQPIEEINQTINKTQLKITLKQYKAVINRPVKWIKKISLENISELKVEIPKNAENITILIDGEVRKAEKEVDEYTFYIENSNRGDIVKSGITGFVSQDIVRGENWLNKFFDWLLSFTISGRVISEQEMENDITKTTDNIIIDLSSVVEQAQEIAVEYYTEAPTSTEENISSGKKVIISATNELDYTDILAYSVLDNRISVHKTGRLKIVWKANYEDAVRYGYIPGREIEDKKNITDEIGDITFENERIVVPEIEQDVSESLNKTILNETIIKSPAENNSVEEINQTEQPEQKSEENTIIKRIPVEQPAETSVEVPAEKTEEKTTEKTEKEEAKEDKKEEKSQEKTEGTTELSITGAIISDEGNIIENQTNEGKIIERTYDVEVNFSVYDLDEDGNIDYVEWIVPHLSNQTYEIIYITKAEHLDSNRTFISDIYDSVKEQDGNWSEIISNSEYVRVTFEQNLTKENDITIYARMSNCFANSVNNSVIINGTEVSCDIYQKKKRIEEIRRLLEG